MNTKSTITRERAQQIFLGSGPEPSASEERELARMALDAMDSESVGTLSVRHMSYSGKKIGNQFGFVHSDAAMTIAEGDYPLYRHAQPVPEYPEVLPCSVLLEPGLRFGKGIKTSNMLAALARRAVYESDMAALSPEERAEFQARIEDFKSLIAQQPVVPDERDKAVDADDHPLLWSFNAGWNACRAAMLQELQKSAGDEVISRSNENVQVLNTIKASPALGSFPKTGEVQNTNPPENQGCWCRACRPVVLNDMRFVVCPDCGNKRCPRANDHRNSCTGSNEPGQEGSAYPDTLQEPKP